LFILEYCEESFLTDREQFWLDTLLPDYNVLKLAYRTTGYSHTEETKQLMSDLAKLRTHSAETKAKISHALTGENNPFFNRHHSIASIKKIQAANSTSQVYLYNEFKILLFTFPSISHFAKIIKANHSSVANQMKEKITLFRGSWYLSSTPFSDNDSPLITDVSSPPGGPPGPSGAPGAGLL
jgi:group I intron endonuclease